jgi:tetratricopeptide (TPR) repeat protein
MARGEVEAVDAVLEVGLAGEPTAWARHWVAWALLRGQLEERRAAWERRARRGAGGTHTWEMLARIHRARGDRKAALPAAEKADSPNLVEALLFEAGDWRALVARPELISTPNPVERLSRLATYQRLAGNDRASAAHLDELARRAKGGLWPPNVLPYAKAFCLNGRPDQALGFLAIRADLVRFDVQMARGEVKEAFATVAAAGARSSPYHEALELRQARALFAMGQVKRARALLDRCRAKVKAGEPEHWLELLLEAQVALGQRDQAFASLARALDGAKGVGHELLFAGLFPGRGDEAGTLFARLREREGAPTAVAIRRARSLLEGSAGAKEVKELGDLGVKGDRAERFWLAAAEAARACGQEEQAVAYLEKAGSATALLRLGDLRAARKEWAKAAEHYGRAVTEAGRHGSGDGSPELALFLQGWALTRAGKATEGARLMERAHWLPLGDGPVRLELALALARRGHHTAADRELKAIPRVVEPDLNAPASSSLAEALRLESARLASRGQHLQAAEALEQACVLYLRPSVTFTDQADCVRLPGRARLYRARGLLGRGKVDEALREAAVAQALLPSSIDVPATLVPELDKRGRKKDADALYGRAVAVWRKLCVDHPTWAEAHASLAWLSVSCGRDLDGALDHARAALALAPTRAEYHDVIAEVLFQKGKTKEAIAAERRAVALAPGSAYHRAQLKRMLSGDPKVPRPVK